MEVVVVGCDLMLWRRNCLAVKTTVWDGRLNRFTGLLVLGVNVLLEAAIGDFLPVSMFLVGIGFGAPVIVWLVFFGC